MELENGNYLIGGIPALDIVREFGKPVYVYYGEKILSQYERLRNAFASERIKIKYACKALNNINIIRLLNKAGAGVDAVSINEVELTLKAGLKPEEILFTPNGVSFDEIKAGVEAGVHINVDNISSLEQLGNVYGDSVPCCIRINPHIEAGGHSHIQ